MTEVLVVREPIQEGVDPWFMARVTSGMGVPLLRSDVNANGVYLRVYNTGGDDPNTVVGIVPSLDPSTTYNGFVLMQDTLQVQGWSKDRQGWNLIYKPSLSILDTSASYGGTTLRWCFELSLAIGGYAYAIFETKVHSTKSN